MHTNVRAILQVLLCLFCSLVSAVVVSADTFWYSRADMQQGGTQSTAITANASFTVWICLPPGSAGSIAVNGKPVTASNSAVDQDTLRWIKSGSVSLKAGERLHVTLSKEDAHVSAAALSTHPDFNPAAAWTLTRVLGYQPGPVTDPRLHPQQHTDSRFHMPAWKSLDAWQQRRSWLRDQIQAASGLLPMPDKTPLEAEFFDRVEHADFITEKVLFQSWPGLYVTANLYRPKNGTGPFPAVLNPHGHWTDGRLADQETGSVVARCINYAKHGFIALAWDMAGWNENKQVPHRFQSDRADLWGVSIFGAQTLNSIRALDLLLSLPDVDPNRIGITGASGGGTQTFIHCAVDDRIHAAGPVNMVSSIMQGGCICENAANLRIGTNNMEIAALFAPKPLFMMSATGDWTRQTLEVEYPAVRSIYQLYNAADHVRAAQLDAPHNYNRDSREHIYAWFMRWLQGAPDRPREPELPYPIDIQKDLAMLPGRPLPADALDIEAYLASRIQASEHQLLAYQPVDQRGLRLLRDVYGPALQHSLNVESVAPQDITVEAANVQKAGGYTVRRLLIGRATAGDKIPALLWLPSNRTDAAGATLLVHPEGKQALLNETHTGPGTMVKQLLDTGQIVLTIDVFLTGEYQGLLERSARAYSEPNVRTEHFLTFNLSDDACRIQDIATAVGYLARRSDTAHINLVGIGRAGLWSLLARSQITGIRRTVIDVNGFENDADTAWLTDCFVPGLRRAGDIRTAAALIAPDRLILHNTGDRFQSYWFTNIYQAATATGNLQVSASRWTEDTIIRYLTGE